MKIFLAVIMDLYLFAKGFFVSKQKQSFQKYLPPGTTNIKIDHLKSQNQNDSLKTTDVIGENGNAGYITVTSAQVFLRPVWAIDTVIATLNLGKKVQLMDYEGRFARVLTEEINGWVLKDMVTTQKQSVWPELISGQMYEAINPATISIRALLEDEFFTSELYVPLQATEYITYRLKEKNITLPWPKTRPRVVGLWYEILKGCRGVVSSLEPKTGSIMEGTLQDSDSFLAYVEAVRVDGSLDITSVGRMLEGQYLRETLSKDQVFSLRPVFIQKI